MVVITGTSSGIGHATACLFLKRGYCVAGIDINENTVKNSDKLTDAEKARYTHYQVDISKDDLPDIEYVSILINNAGVQDGDVIGVNLVGTMRCTEKYALSNPDISAVLNLSSVSAHNGAEFMDYCASKGGVLSYTVATAKAIAPYGAVCNSISFGGVITPLNAPVITDSHKWSKIMDMTPLKKWATSEEAAEWIFFMTTVNKSCSGQDVIIDNLESWNHRFVW